MSKAAASMSPSLTRVTISGVPRQVTMSGTFPAMTLPTKTGKKLPVHLLRLMLAALTVNTFGVEKMTARPGTVPASTVSGFILKTFQSAGRTFRAMVTPRGPSATITKLIGVRAPRAHGRNSQVLSTQLVLVAAMVSWSLDSTLTTEFSPATLTTIRCTSDGDHVLENPLTFKSGIKMVETLVGRE